MLAVPFDLATLDRPRGWAPIVEGVRRSTATVSSAAQFDFSNSGVMVYVPGPTSDQEAVFLYDRKGGAQALTLPPGSYRYPRVSPDGKHVALRVERGQGSLSSRSTSCQARPRPRASRSAATTATRSGPTTGNTWRFNRTETATPAVFWQADRWRQRRTADERPNPARRMCPSRGRGTACCCTACGRARRRRCGCCRWRTVRRRSSATWSRQGLPTNAAFSPDGQWVVLSDRESGCVGGIDLRAAVPGDRHEARDWPWRPAALVARQQRAVLHPGAGQCRAGQVAEADVLVHIARGGAPAVWDFRSVEPRTFDFLPDGRLIGVGPAPQATGGAELRVVLNWFEELKARVPVK